MKSNFNNKKKNISIIFLRFINLDENLKEQINFCKYTHIPLCNLEEDRYNFTIDLFYSRLLKHANCISWFVNLILIEN